MIPGWVLFGKVLPWVNDDNAATFEVSNVAGRNGCAIRTRDRGNLAVELADRPTGCAPIRGNVSIGNGGRVIKRQDTRPKILLQNAIHHASKRSAPMSGGHDGDPETQFRLA